MRVLVLCLALAVVGHATRLTVRSDDVVKLLNSTLAQNKYDHNLEHKLYLETAKTCLDEHDSVVAKINSAHEAVALNYKDLRTAMAQRDQLTAKRTAATKTKAKAMDQKAKEEALLAQNSKIYNMAKKDTDFAAESCNMAIEKFDSLSLLQDSGAGANVRRAIWLADAMGIAAAAPLTGFLQGDKSGSVAQHGGTQVIVKMLEDLKAQLVEKSEELAKTWETTKASHHDTISSKAQQIQSLESEIAGLTTNIEEQEKNIGTAVENLMEQRSVLMSELKTLMRDGKRCEREKLAFDEATRTFDKTVFAYQQAIKFVSKVKDEFLQRSQVVSSKSVARPFVKNVDFLQTAETKSMVKVMQKLAVGEGMRRELVRAVKAASRETGVDKFAKVRDLINNLVNRLAKEQEEEAGVMGECKRELGLIKSKSNTAARAMNKALNDVFDSAQESEEMLTDCLLETLEHKHVQDLTSMATDTFRKMNKTYSEMIATASTNINLLEQAIKSLKGDKDSHDGTEQEAADGNMGQLIDMLKAIVKDFDIQMQEDKKTLQAEYESYIENKRDLQGQQMTVKTQHRMHTQRLTGARELRQSSAETFKAESAKFALEMQAKVRLGDKCAQYGNAPTGARALEMQKAAMEEFKDKTVAEMKALAGAYCALLGKGADCSQGRSIIPSEHRR